VRGPVIAYWPVERTRERCMKVIKAIDWHRAIKDNEQIDRATQPHKGWFKSWRRTVPEAIAYLEARSALARGGWFPCIDYEEGRELMKNTHYAATAIAQDGDANAMIGLTLEQLSWLGLIV